jgi:bla regulator protein BlaR1
MEDSMRTLIIVTAASFVFHAGGGAALAQSAQSPPNERRFEVASVKPALSPAELGRLAAQSGGPPQFPRFGIQTQPGGRFSAGTSTLKALIAEAFEVKDYQIDGGPPWLTTDYFEITANAGADATPADIKAMLRTLLAERFGLRTRSDTRQAPMYVLTVARSDGRLGSRLTPATPECIQQIEQRRNRPAEAAASPPTPPSEAEQREQRERMQAQLKRLASGDSSVPPTCGTSMMGMNANGTSTLLAGGTEFKTLVTRISSELSAPVLDQTGLAGLFDISLEYLSARTINGRPGGLDPNSTDPLPVPLTGALQQQLGLKLEKQTGPMPVVIIDAADHPTPD